MQKTDKYFMQEVLKIAQELSEKQSEQDLSEQDIPIAAIIVKDGEIIASGFNSRQASLKDPSQRSITGHAEINAIEAAVKKLGDWNLSGCTIYVNLEPCTMCAGAILQSHIPKVVFGAYDPKIGALGSRYDIRTKKLEVVGGIIETECAKLLKEFFLQLR